jgi:hypothetical protein
MGNSIPSSKIGDGNCDDGTEYPHFFHLHCSAYSFDNGDCEEDADNEFDPSSASPEPAPQSCECTFPFTYKDITYSDCTDADHTQLWCPTAVNNDGVFDGDMEVSGLMSDWGNCVKICPTWCQDSTDCDAEKYCASGVALADAQFFSAVCEPCHFCLQRQDAAEGDCPARCAESTEKDNEVISDCTGHYAPAEWVGDGMCDNGIYDYAGEIVNLDCEAMHWDGGDCIIPAEVPGAVTATLYLRGSSDGILGLASCDPVYETLQTQADDCWAQFEAKFKADVSLRLSIDVGRIAITSFHGLGRRRRRLMEDGLLIVVDFVILPDAGGVPIPVESLEAALTADIQIAGAVVTETVAAVAAVDNAAETLDLVTDCHGRHAPRSMVGDGFCQDGGLQAGVGSDHHVDFDCVPFKFDQGDCKLHASPRVEVFAVDGVEKHTTYRLLVDLAATTRNFYAIYGSNEDALTIPAAWQHPLPFGTNIGGVLPAFFEFEPLCEFDSWLSVGPIELKSKMASIGIDFAAWGEDKALFADNGAVFLMDPANGYAGTVVVAQLTIRSDAPSFTAVMGAQGKSHSGPDWNDNHIVFTNAPDGVAEAAPAARADSCTDVYAKWDSGDGDLLMAISFLSGPSRGG